MKPPHSHFQGQAPAALAHATVTPLVVRSNPPSQKHYRDYKQSLRYDFFFMCAYCTVMEVEAGGVRFTIDHYEPTTARPELETDYNNLMWACDECNKRKGDRYPPPPARADGNRFFRPDEDIHTQHFEISGKRLNAKTNIGQYTIDAVDLNRYALMKLRELRLRWVDASQNIAEGISALNDYPLDRLPKDLRGRIYSAIQRISKDAELTSQKVDGILREEARSKLLDDDPDPADASEEDILRKDRLKALEALYGGNWRGRYQRPAK